MNAEDIAAMQFVIDEANERWEAVLAADREKPSVVFGEEGLAAKWLVIFGGEDRCKLVLDGLVTIGWVVNDMWEKGHILPPEIQAFRDQWWAEVVARDMMRPPSERTTDEGKAAAMAEREERRRQYRQWMEELHSAERLFQYTNPWGQKRYCEIVNPSIAGYVRVRYFDGDTALADPEKVRKCGAKWRQRESRQSD